MGPSVLLHEVVRDFWTTDPNVVAGRGLGVLLDDVFDFLFGRCFAIIGLLPGGAFLVVLVTAGKFLLQGLHFWGILLDALVRFGVERDYLRLD